VQGKANFLPVYVLVFALQKIFERKIFIGVTSQIFNPIFKKIFILELRIMSHKPFFQPDF